MKKVVVFTGAGVSAESGIKTFRDSGGLWEEYDVMDVATPEAWARQPKTVLKFYNERRIQIIEAKPNKGHALITKLEEYFDVSVITQNIDDLHERAGSTNVLHLHGEIMKSRSSLKENLLYPVDELGIEWGHLCELGSQLRPHVVWFGESVPAMLEAERIVSKAETLIVVGTSLNVYPAAGLIYSCQPSCPIYLVDPIQPATTGRKINWIGEKAGTGLRVVMEQLLNS